MSKTSKRNQLLDAFGYVDSSLLKMEKKSGMRKYIYATQGMVSKAQEKVFDPKKQKTSDIRNFLLDTEGSVDSKKVKKMKLEKPKSDSKGGSPLKKFAKGMKGGFANASMDAAGVSKNNPIRQAVNAIGAAVIGLFTGGLGLSIYAATAVSAGVGAATGYASGGAKGAVIGAAGGAIGAGVGGALGNAGSQTATKVGQQVATEGTKSATPNVASQAINATRPNTSGGMLNVPEGVQQAQQAVKAYDQVKNIVNPQQSVVAAKPTPKPTEKAPAKVPETVPSKNAPSYSAPVPYDDYADISRPAMGPESTDRAPSSFNQYKNYFTKYAKKFRKKPSLKQNMFDDEEETEERQDFPTLEPYDRSYVNNDAPLSAYYGSRPRLANFRFGGTYAKIR